MKPDLTFHRAINAEQAFERITQALTAIGIETRTDEERGIVTSKVFYITAKVELTVQVKEVKEGSQVDVAAYSLEQIPNAVNNVLARFEHAFDNFDKPGFQSNIIGVPDNVIKAVLGIVLVLLILGFVFRLF